MDTVARLLPRAFTLVHRPAAAPRNQHWRRRLLAAALLAAVLGAGYLFWLRDSRLVGVERVTVVGLSAAPDAPRLRAELTRAARGMTTLHADSARLRAVVAGDPVVRAIEVTPRFPHSLRIDVVENRPVAVVSSGGRSVPVAADGTLLEGVDVNGRLPAIRTVAGLGPRRVGGGSVLGRVTVAGAAPPALLARVASITLQPGRGYVAQLAHGPAIWLGGLPDLDLKWAAAAAVLAQPSSEGASYVDVRLPGRPVAGGLAVSAVAQAAPELPASGSVTGAPAPIPAAPGAQVPSATTTTPSPATTTQSAGAPSSTATPATTTASNPRP